MSFATASHSVDDDFLPGELCRLSQAAFDDGHPADAADLARRALRHPARDEAVLDYVAWLFCSTRDEDEALEVLRLIATSRPLSAAQHAYISGATATRGNFQDAIEHSRRAAELDPDNSIYIRHRASVLELAGRPVESAAILVAAARRNSNDSLVFDQLAHISRLLGKVVEGKIFASRAWALDPGNRQLGRALAHALMTAGDYADATIVLDRLRTEGDDDASVALMHSIALSQDGRFEEASIAADEGLVQSPQHTALLMQQGAVLCCLALYDRAADVFAKILAVAPDHEAAGRASFAALTEAGRYAEATTIGARLVATNPADEQTGRTLQHVLTRRFIDVPHSVMDGRSLAALKLRNVGLRPVRPRPTLGRAFAAQVRILVALLLRELITRFGRSSIGYAWVLFEPLAHISIMVTLISTFAHGDPPVGETFAVFYFTGIIPYHLFTHTASQICVSIPANRAMLQLPIVTTIDVFLSRGILEFLTECSVALIFVVAFGLIGLHSIPINPIGVITALVQLWIVALSVGIFNAIIVAHFGAWERIWGALMSVLYFSSGTFYVPQIMPVEIRNVLAWNPVLQAIELVRANYFHVPQHPWVSSSYMWMLAVELMAASLVLERVFRRRLTAAE